MTDIDGFDRRLTEALRAYAFDAPEAPDAAAFARAIVRGHPRRSWPSSVLRVTLGRPLRLALTIGLLLLLTALVAIGVGAWMRDRSLPIRSPSAFPLALRYGFEGNGPGADALGNYGMYHLDFDGEALVRVIDGASGSAHARNGVWGSVEDWAGRADRFGGTGATAGDGVVSIRAPEPCGDASYRLRNGDDGLHLTVIQDSCTERIAILTRTPWLHAGVPLVAGHRYDSFAFTEPFRFVAAVDAKALPWIGSGTLRLSDLYWRVWVFDDVAVPVDVCDASKGSLPDIPATPTAVEAWLRGSPSLPVSGVERVVVDGRDAIRLDIGECRVPPTTCNDCPVPRPDEFRLGSRLYAVPTGSDIILVVVWGETSADDISAEAFAEGLVGSMIFSTAEPGASASERPSAPGSQRPATGPATPHVGSATFLPGPSAAQP
jgi:hypothetical protein